MKKALLSTLMHVVELMVVLAAAYVVTQIFNINSEIETALIALAMGAVTKFVRANDSIPVNDYVNRE